MAKSLQVLVYLLGFAVMAGCGRQEEFYGVSANGAAVGESSSSGQGGSASGTVPGANPVQSPSRQSKASDEDCICHIPPGNPRQRKTMQLPANAVSAHLDHGDYRGNCQ